APRTTVRAVLDIARTPHNQPVSESSTIAPDAPPVTAPAEPLNPPSAQEAEAHADDSAASEPVVTEPDTPLSLANRQRVQLGLYVVAVVVGIWAARLLAEGWRFGEQALRDGLPFVLLALGIWFFAEIFGDWPRLRQRWRNRGSDERPHAADRAEQPPGAVSWRGLHPVRVFAGLGALVFALSAYIGTAGNQFRFLGFWSWVISIVLIVITLAPSSWTPGRLWRVWRSWWRGVNWRGGTLPALVAILLVGAFFRLYDLGGMPPEMTSDHMEKLLDAHRVAEGDYQVFFPNNGGREGFQMYAIALLSRLPGLGIDYTSLKLLTVLEGLLTLPVLWWFGREIVGERDRRLGNAVGLALVALVAVSYWHLILSRLALRIVLTPLITALLLIFLARGMRHNRRGDFILAGLTLGFGLYMYQAVRMLPVVVLAGVGLAMLYNLRNRQQLRRYVANLAALVAVSFVVFVPLFRFSMDYPDLFWMRSTGRILGDTRINAGSENAVTVSEWLGAFGENMTILAENIRDALLMYNWRGDVAWINGVSLRPVMDIFTGGLLIVGLAAWLVLILRRHRDPVYPLIPLALFIMLLPSALAVAMPLENPSASRTSGSLPSAYLLAAFPLGLIAYQLWRTVPRRMGLLLAASAVLAVTAGAYTRNFDLYYDDYRRVYETSSLPHSEPGRMLREFGSGEGAYGNVFIVAYPYWWDHRIVGLEAGLIDWSNTIPLLEQGPNILSDSFYCAERRYRLDPERDLMFFYHRDDDEGAGQLRQWFPDGSATLVESYQFGQNFMTYRVPAPGLAGFEDFVRVWATDPSCEPGF
ncbi:MAG: ArnT family glycosyltransferase, partial [Phototrophicaceae bacterium]